MLKGVTWNVLGTYFGSLIDWKRKLSVQIRSRNLKLSVQSYWQQQSRVNWIKEGDANSKFFHQDVKEKVQRQHIQAIKRPNGEWVYDTKEIGKEVKRRLERLYGI
ncbi:unnamed protein product [Cuscuta europaea]|uniref:Uncharacterized protein n=1 Tax=Cuscuta europaea TaxID=41803 RepID=A0A9P0YTG8_CUSEU|nr:unnamed protein product [Cuscuta europaea]